MKKPNGQPITPSTIHNIALTTNEIMALVSAAAVMVQTKPDDFQARERLFQDVAALDDLYGQMEGAVIKLRDAIRMPDAAWVELVNIEVIIGVSDDISRILPYTIGTKVKIVDGYHAGKRGTVSALNIFKPSPDYKGYYPSGLCVSVDSSEIAWGVHCFDSREVVRDRESEAING